MKLNTKMIVNCSCIVALSGCATMKDSVLTGVGTGALIGAGVGTLADRDNSGGTWKGAAIGSVVGGLTGYLIKKGLDDRDADTRKETLFNLEKYSVSRPTSQGINLNYTIAAPGVETECYETQVRGNKLIQAHCESVITGTPEWVVNPQSNMKGNSNKNESGK